MGHADAADCPRRDGYMRTRTHRWGRREYRGVSRAVRRAVLADAAGRCAACGRKAERLEVDHVIPVSEGGSHAAANLQALCVDCHRLKSAAEGTRGRARARLTESQPVSRHMHGKNDKKLKEQTLRRRRPPRFFRTRRKIGACA